MASASKVPIWWIVLLVFAAVLPRLPVVPAAFDIEDLALVEYAGNSASLGSVALDPSPIGYYRPLVILHFKILQSIFGEWAPGYHAVSIMLHGLAVWLVFLLATRVGCSGWPAMGGALVFALLPSSNKAIAWAASAGDLWAVVFTIVAVILALVASEGSRGSRPWLWVASLAVMVLGLAAKETAIVAALLIPAAAWLFGLRRPTWGWTVAYPAVAIAYLSWFSARLEGEGSLTSLFTGDLWLYLMRTVQNLVMMLVPFARNSIGDWLWSGPGMTRIVTLGVLASLLAILAAALLRGNRAAVFGLLWSVAAFLPVCWLGWAEHYAYLPAVGVALVTAAALNPVRRRRMVVVNAVMIAVLVAFAIGSLQSALQWTQRVGRYAPKSQNRSSAAAQWKPAPKAARSTRSPALIRPC